MLATVFSTIWSRIFNWNSIRNHQLLFPFLHAMGKAMGGKGNSKKAGLLLSGAVLPFVYIRLRLIS